MSKSVFITLSLAIGVFIAGIFTSLFAAQDEPSAVSTEDPTVPVEELALLLKAFTKEELLVEAKEWQSLLRKKAIEIAKAEIIVKLQNREIEKAKEIEDQAEEAKEQLEKLQEKTADAKATGDVEAMRETEEVVREAQESATEIRESVGDAAEATKKTAEVAKTMEVQTPEIFDETMGAADQAEQALGKAKDVVESATLGERAAVHQAAGEAEQTTEEAKRATAVVGENVRKAEMLDRTMEQAEEVKKEAKVELLETVNRLREERTQLIDRLNTVLSELESKTDKEDSETLDKIKDYRLYISSVQGIQVDAKDATSTWISIKGWLTSAEGGLRWAKNVGTFAAIILIAWLLSKLISRAVHRALSISDKLSHLLEDFLVGMVRWIVMAIGATMALAALEVSVGPLLALIGAVGFVLALALQDSLSNFANGIMILLFRPFDVGDVVDAGGVSGSVTSMNLVSTTIKTFDNKQMVVPNNKIWRDVITNATGVATRRVDMEFGIGYGDDIDKAQAILEEVVNSHPKVLADPEPTIRMNTLADSSVNFICRPWSRTEDYWSVYWDVTKEVKKRFDAEGICIPFPQRDVHLYIKDAAPQKNVAAMGSVKRT
jgi:small conductance mechanosensitive channel